MPAELMRAFAEAVAAHGRPEIDATQRGKRAPCRGKLRKALIYRPDGTNRKGEWRSLDHALALAETESRPFAVYVRDDIVVGDFDDPELAQAALELAGELRAEGLTPVLVASGQKGRRHLFVRVYDLDQRDRLTIRFRDAGADVRTNSPIRPPLSPHRYAEVRPRLLDPSDPEAALAALRPEQASTQPRPRRDLSEAARRLLEVDAIRVPGRTDRSRAVWSAILALANAGWTEGEAWEAMRAKPVGRRYATGDRSRAHFACEWTRAVRYTEEHPALTSGSDVRARVQALLDEQEAKPWPGIAGASAKAVLTVHASIAMRRGAVPYSASIRELADRAGMSLPTVRAANQRLQRMGLLAQARMGGVRDGRRAASSWRLALPEPGANATSFSHTSSHPPAVGLNGKRQSHSERLVRHDATRWGGGLGKAVVGLLVALGDGPSAVGRLAARLGRSRDSVARQLARLAALGLAVRGDGKRGLYSLTVESEALLLELDRVAVRLGTAGRGQRARDVFAEQRLIFDMGRSSRLPRREEVTGRTFGIKRPAAAPAAAPVESERRQAAKVRQRRSTRPPAVDRGQAAARSTLQGATAPGSSSTKT